MSRFSEYRPSGPAELRRVRGALAVDFAASVVLAALAFPFPIVRASVSVPVFVALIIAATVLAHLGLIVTTTLALGRTPGMYLLDLGFREGTPRGLETLGWALGTIALFWPIVIGIMRPADPGAYAHGGVVLVSTSMAD